MRYPKSRPIQPRTKWVEIKQVVTTRGVVVKAIPVKRKNCSQPSSPSKSSPSKSSPSRPRQQAGPSSVHNGMQEYDNIVHHMEPFEPISLPKTKVGFLWVP